jgi:ATP phosphoribosyltransferase regulatory subunit
MRPDFWLLPDGMNEILPPDTYFVEQLRQEILTLFDTWGFNLVSPPLVEYLDALLTGTGNDLDLQTFKLVDQISGRTLGIRSDMTPQVARIDAHQLKQSGPARYCYIGTVLKTRTSDFSSSRNPLQLGAELFGHQGAQSDVEIMELMLRTIQLAGIDSVYLDIGHVGIYRSLAREAELDSWQEHTLFDALQRKALPEIHQMVRSLNIHPSLANALNELAMLSGGEAVLAEAGTLLRPLNVQGVNLALDHLEEIRSCLKVRIPEVPIHFDLSELRGYAYKTGTVFAAFVPGVGREIARGGRYDEIGKLFGQARPATGFSADLKTWVSLSSRAPQEKSPAIFAPAVDDGELGKQIKQLRSEGKRVIQQLPGQTGHAEDAGCSEILVKQGESWNVISV